ncbi:hypothetical protein BC826DRAFT_545554 [Russula brevipes]|nr:hypothetical protein BC826DRAFT_545554 [Russula brevipes]
MPSVSGIVPPSSPSEAPSSFGAALANYTRQTGRDLTKNPVTAKIESCCTPNSIFDVLQDQALVFDEFRNGDSKLVKSLRSIVDGLHAISTYQALGGSASLHAFSGIGVLLTVCISFAISDRLVKAKTCDRARWPRMRMQVMMLLSTSLNVSRASSEVSRFTPLAKSC